MGQCLPEELYGGYNRSVAPAPSVGSSHRIQASTRNGRSSGMGAGAASARPSIRRWDKEDGEDSAEGGQNDSSVDGAEDDDGGGLGLSHGHGQRKKEMPQFMFHSGNQPPPPPPLIPDASAVYDLVEDNEEICPTCLEEYSAENPKIDSVCGHTYHLACIYEWLERSPYCPICAKKMVFQESTAFYSKEKPAIDDLDNDMISVVTNTSRNNQAAL